MLMKFIGRHQPTKTQRKQPKSRHGIRRNRINKPLLLVLYTWKCQIAIQILRNVTIINNIFFFLILPNQPNLHPAPPKPSWKASPVTSGQRYNRNWLMLWQKQRHSASPKPRQGRKHLPVFAASFTPGCCSSSLANLSEISFLPRVWHYVIVQSHSHIDAHYQMNSLSGLVKLASDLTRPISPKR